MEEKRREEKREKKTRARSQEREREREREERERDDGDNLQLLRVTEVVIGITGYTEYYLRRGKGEEKANERTNAVFFLLSTAFFFFL